MPESRTKALIAVALFALMSFLMLNGIDSAIAKTKVELEGTMISNRVNYIENASTIDKNQLMCLAKNVYFESRGEPERGMKAVAHVTLNRVNHRNFPKSVCGVVYQRHNGSCQFSWYCDGRADQVRSRDAWLKSMQIAFSALTGQSKDPTHGATHFYNYRIVEPDWSRRFRQTAVIGSHSFYKMS